MPTLNSGQSATVTVPAGMPFRVNTTSEATVSQTWQGGSPVFLDRLVGSNLSKIYPANSGTQTYLIAGVSGVTDYGGGYVGQVNTTPEVASAAQLTAMNQALVAGSASYPVGYEIIADGVSYTLQGLGSAASFTAGGSGSSSSGISSKLIAAIPMRGNVASTGLPKDLSPSLATLLLMPGLNDATFYGTDEYGTVIAAVNGGAILPKEQVSLSCIAGRNIGLLLCLKKATPGATEAFLGWGDGTNPGVNLAMTSAGKLNVAAVARLVSSPATLSTHNLSASVVGIADADCPIALDINYQRQRIDLYVRGKYISTIVFANAAGKREIPQLQSLVLGGIGGDNQTTFAAQFKGFIQVVVLDDNYTDFETLAQVHAANVSQPINGAVL